MYNNRYFLLRHGKNAHQEEKKHIIYGYPDDNPPCDLNEEGVREIKRAGELLKDKNIDLIVCSDILRTRHTAEIVSEIINYNINNIIFDKRLRDNNWGVFAKRLKQELWDFYGGERIKAFEIAPDGGESWQDCQFRVVEVFNELENKYTKKNILVISHSNPLWLLEGYLNSTNNQEMLDHYSDIIKTGEIRELN
ncbi:histidine phosphatase family protein [bacterium]|nr:histidine phosphatase family protein [bacterium]